ncbi:50S ribosomal protein L4 [Candidatus Saccharibacteria bacterium]|jgi:large subunit ribosomal protein L4|nr:50S ribosomal protein L4 [Candidatus Saccharibacteria bacterium]MBP7834460.1 50S ribosomal protein L4 [Candidatus Saccharibacteria bacterium]
MATPTFNSNGAKATTAVKLPSSIFAVEVDNHQLLKDVYVAHMANGRGNLAKTLKRGEVSGGGRKPWRQKGTGNARTGSIRNPIWRGGGITFGPSGNENYTKKVNAKARKQSLKQALSLAVKDNRVVVIDDFVVKDGKTSTAAKLLAKINTPSRVTIVVDQISTELGRSLANLQEVNVLTFRSLSTYDVLNGNTLLFTSSAVKGIETRLGGAK